MKFLSILLLASMLYACDKNDNSQAIETENTPVEQVLHISVGASPQSIDPHVVTGVPGMKVLAGLGESLVTLNLSTQQIEPAAAESWQISDDGLTYTFNLRKNARWSNGEPVTAGDFVHAWQRAMTPTVGWQFATDYYFIQGTEAFHQGETDDVSTLGITALDEHTLVFQLERAYPIFLKQLTGKTNIPLHKKSMQAFGDFEDINSDWSKAGNFVGNGAFILENWEINKVIVLKKNPYYHNADNVKLEKVFIYPIESESAEERSFRAGQIQLAYGGRIPVDKIRTYKEKKPEQLKIVNAFATYFYLFNVTEAPFDDVRVRKALSHAIDRDAIVKYITKAGEGVAVTLNPPAAASYSDITPLTYDLSYAKKLLADAGYPNGEGFPEVSLIYNTSDLHRKVALAIQQMWKEKLGISVTLENQEWKVFLNTRQDLDFQIARAGSVSSIGDPQDFLEAYKTGHGMNDTGWSNSEFDAIVNQASNTVNDEERYQLLAKAENILLEDMPLIPLYYYANSYLIDDSVKGLEFNPFSRINYHDIYIDQQ